MSNYTMSPVVNGEKKQMIVKVGDTQPIGTIVDYDGSTIPNGWQQVENVLWENTSPTTAIENGAEFSLSSSDYDYYSIIYNLSTSGTNISFNTEKIPKGQGTVLSIITSGASNFTGLQRNINHTSDTKLTSGVPYSFNNSSRSIDNTALIPIKIIGYKKQIKKIAPVTPANGNIKNSYGTSQTDTYSQEYINNKINDQSSNIVRKLNDTTNFVIATNHVNNIMDFYYNKSTGLCVFTFRITTKDNDTQYNVINAWQNQVTIPSKYAPRALNFNPVYVGNGTCGVVRVQPRTDNTNKGKVDVYGHANYNIVEGTLIWYIEPGID